MNEPITAIGREYMSSLAAYLRQRDESTLSCAYELGRRAIVQGMGVLDVAALHRAAVRAFVGSAAIHDQAKFADDSVDFFYELLAPFEMSFRGYRVANAELQRLNETLTRQKETVESVNRELESFSYSVSHDLRAPLRKIDGFSQVLLEDFGEVLKGEGRKHLHRIREAAQRMSQLIDDLIGLARVTRTEVHRGDVDLTALVRGICDKLQAGAPQRACTFAIEEGIRGNGDARLLAVLLENLLGNAWKFTSKREIAEIAFGVAERAGLPTYFVRDNGAGFDMAYAEKLFGAFQRLHSANEFEGTGIGLATVQRVVHRHGGRVWAESKVAGGATFYFTLGETAR